MPLVEAWLFKWSSFSKETGQLAVKRSFETNIYENYFWQGIIWYTFTPSEKCCNKYMFKYWYCCLAVCRLPDTQLINTGLEKPHHQSRVSNLVQDTTNIFRLLVQDIMHSLKNWQGRKGKGHPTRTSIVNKNLIIWLIWEKSVLNFSTPGSTPFSGHLIRVFCK